jgi:cysteine desulfurase family protein
VIYLDSAATTMQKPPSVSRACVSAMRTMASPGRGGHRPAMLAARTAFACREEAAALFGVNEPENVVFTFNATHGLNIAIKSLVKRGDTVLISGYEHNAVTRPLHALGAVVKVAYGPLFQPEAMFRSFEEQLTPEVCAVVCNHVSNVFGYILPVERIAALCRARGVPFILDASQSAGCLPVDMSQLKAAFIAMPGHKGLYGPQGTGLLLCGTDTQPLLEGGTGSMSARQEMPDFLPDRLEAGTHNIPGIAGLLEGIRYVRREGPLKILERERRLMQTAAKGLSALPEITVYADPQGSAQAGVLSFQVGEMDCELVGEALGKCGIAVRAGLHCSPLAHRSAGTYEKGTVRASFSSFNSRLEAERLVWEIGHLNRKNSR